MDEQTYDVEVTREFDAPIARVWQAWTTPADLREWWGPQGFTCPRADADVRPGGSIVVTMKAPAEWGGSEHHSRWDIGEATPPTALRYIFRFCDADGRVISPGEAGVPPGVPDESRHEVVLTDLGDGRTRLRMVEHGYLTAEARDLSAGGLEQCLDKMADLVGRAN
jgi:uncharacterized protein YndB with AHSA1/START domain